MMGRITSFSLADAQIVLNLSEGSFGVKQNAAPLPMLLGTLPRQYYGILYAREGFALCMVQWN